nr:EOG090X0BTB [Eulimnadia texana]
MSSEFAAAFGNLKKSEFYQKEVEELGKPGPSKSEDNGETKKIIVGYKSGSIIVNQRQRGNPLLKSVRNVPWEFGEIVPDYLMGSSTCALFLSLRYHSLNSQYIHERLKDLGKQYDLRVLLVQVDVKDPYHLIKELTKISLLADLTLMLAWSPEEAGRIIETYKVFENKPPDLIMEKQENSSYMKLVDALTSIKSVNKSDASTLLANFRTVERIYEASEEDLSLCPGIGPLKAQKIRNCLRQNFRKNQ